MTIIKTLRGSQVVFGGAVWMSTDRECPSYIKGTLPGRGDAAPCVVVVAVDQIEGGKEAVLRAMAPAAEIPAVTAETVEPVVDETPAAPDSDHVPVPEPVAATPPEKRQRRRGGDSDMGIF